MNISRSLPARLEALCLLGLAVFITYLVVGGNYWMYLNPKFRWITSAAGVVLAGLGVFSLLRPPAHLHATWLRAGLFTLVLALCLVSELGIRTTLTRLGVEQPDDGWQTMEEPVAPHVTVQGREYIRINVGELFDLATKRTPETLDVPYAVRGFAFRTPELDAAGQFLLYRTALYCCFADATAVGFRVQLPKGTAPPAHGDWLVVMGTLAPAHDITGSPDPVIPGSPFASVQPEFRIQAEHLEKQKAPGLGLMYDWRQEEPYAY